jgi:hypothetical protein
MAPKGSSKMENNSTFKPETIDAFRQVCSEKREALEYMQKFGAPIERAMAKMIFSAVERERV